MLALIAGRGALPAAVARTQDTAPLVCALEGHAPDGLRVDLTFRIETLGSLLSDLQRRGIARVCLCGSIQRPEIDLARIDDSTMPLVPVLRDALRAGDDGALRVVIGLFEAAGLIVLAAHEAAPELLMSAGVPTALQPTAETAADAVAAGAALAMMARADMGQACIVVQGSVMATEDMRGTDAMLAGFGTTPPAPPSDPLSWVMDTAGDMLGDAAEWLSGPDGSDGPDSARPTGTGILFKAPKPGQDRRADLPTIGPTTVQAVTNAGLAGIVIEAGGVLVLDQPRVLADLDRAGLFLWSRAADI